jgi:hypothetical protein
VQHFAFGDYLVGSVMIFWPFSQSYFGLDIPMVSTLDVILEATGLLLAIGVSYFNGDIKRLLSLDNDNFLMLFPFLALLSSMLYFPINRYVRSLFANILSSGLLMVIVLLHIILLVFLASSALQGFRSLLHNTDKHSE